MPNLKTNSRFSVAPTVKARRSQFARPFNIKTTFNAGDIIPFYVEEVLPGDTVKLKTYDLVRMSTSIHPTMDNCYIDTYYFFVPNRLVWQNWQKFCGDQDVAWVEDTTPPTIPQINCNNSGTSIVTVGSLYDYMGLPLGYLGKASALPFRAYNLIYNEWFRNENATDKVAVYTGNSESNSFSVLKANKYKDYFTSVLPAPQKGADVLIPDSGSTVILRSSVYPETKQLIIDESGLTPDGPLLGLDTYGHLQAGADDGTGMADAVDAWFDPNGTLGVNLNVTVNQLRLAFQTQRLLELDARGGTRYVEILKAHFNVTAPDASLQRPEYLGGCRRAINMSEVYQTAPSTGAPVGNLAGVSKTPGFDAGFTKSFVEHGYLIGVAVVRTDHTYCYGVPKHFMRETRFDYYWPVLANIGEQPVYNYEIDAIHKPNKNNGVFGYQEAWADYRYSPNRLAGYFRNNASGSLSSWHYGDQYSDLPAFGDTWIKETPANIDRTLTVQSSTMHQFLADIRVESVWSRVMPVFSIPGLIDHN